MKYLVTILFFALCGVSYGQSPTGTKTRTPGIWLSSKDTATNRTAADSIQIIANRADSSLRFYWSVGAPSRKIAFIGNTVLYSDTAAMLSGYNLQRVTNLGSTTTQNITANSFLLPASGNAITTDGSSMYIKAGNGNIYIGRDNVVKAEPDGKLSALSFIKSGGTSSQFLKADGSVDNNTYATTSSLATKLNISDTAAMLTYYLRNRTGLSDSYAIGNGSMLNATSGTRNIGLGSFSLQNNTDGGNNVAIGYEALKNGSSISNNTAIGYAAGSAAIPTDVENSVYLGYNSTPQAFSSVTNEIVIGASTTGNGSNTVTIGNSSITNNYFTGNVRGGAFIKSGGTSSQFLKADGSVDGNTYATTSSLGSYAYRSSGLAELSGATFTGDVNSTATIYSNGNITEGSGYRLNAITMGYNSTSGYGWITAGGASSRTFLSLNGGGGNVGIGTTVDNGVNKLQVNGSISGTTASFSASYAGGGSVNIMNWSRSGGDVAADITYNDATTSMNFGTSTAHTLNLKTNGTTALSISSTGAATFSSLAGTGDRVVVANSSGTLSTSSTITSGTYTPTASNAQNAGTITVYEHKYSRIGNIVTVSGVVQYTTTASGVVSAIEITLPFSTTFTSTLNATGTANCSSNFIAGYVSGNNLNNKAVISFKAGASGTVVVANYTFQYQVL